MTTGAIMLMSFITIFFGFLGFLSVYHELYGQKKEKKGFSKKIHPAKK